MSELVTLDSPVTVLYGVGKTRAAYYERLGIRTLKDLIEHYPRAYENRGDIRLLCDGVDGAKHAYLLTVASAPKVVHLRSHKSFLKFRAFDDSAACEIIYFNQDFLRNSFSVGSIFRFYGKLEVKGYNQLSLPSPVAEPWSEDAHLLPLAPVYRRTDGISPKQIASDVAAALAKLAAAIRDPLPDELRTSRRLCTLPYALRNIHLPDSTEALAAARKRLVYDEFFTFSLGTGLSRQRAKIHGAPICNADPTPLLASLPYKLTGAQERAIREICHDMATDIPMSRILVGDVGCGKTVCAAAAMYVAAASGRQAALMAPTEILARQHYADLSPMFAALGLSCELLIGATPAAQKRRIKEALSSPDSTARLPLVIGTHALLSDGVEFSAPGIVITDEQHRFGARQRAALTEKSLHAHLLVMSATPIPRSLALVLYGDLDISRIDEMPPGRQRVDTFAVDESYRTRLNGFIRKQVEQGGQVYVVCPAIEEAEETATDEFSLSELLDDRMCEKEEHPPLKAAKEFAKTLQEAFPDLAVDYLHGRMKSAEKDQVMEGFASGKTSILVSTTVIEVGVNVPNASLMIVENAERFGLSQLHQLRGRVGRGKRKSYCILVVGEGVSLSERSAARLNTMHTTYDGYAIAEQDLAQRGPGDFLATAADGSVRQSGGLCFRLADAGEDVTLLTEAAADARALLDRDPQLRAYPLLRQRAEALFSIEAGLIS